ncbi:MAG: hypothetical protein ACLFQQ_18215, partial [Desulfococcaceae bacterium]
MEEAGWEDGKKGASARQLQYAADSNMISFPLDRSLAGMSGETRPDRMTMDVGMSVLSNGFLF